MRFLATHDAKRAASPWKKQTNANQCCLAACRPERFLVGWNERAAMPPAWLLMSGGHPHPIILTTRKSRLIKNLVRIRQSHVDGNQDGLSRQLEDRAHLSPTARIAGHDGVHSACRRI